MATAKSVLTIDVEDASFKRFAESFKKFQDSVSAATKGVKDLGSEGAKSAQKANVAWEKFTKAMKDLKNNLHDNIEAMKEMARWSGQVASNFTNIAFNAAKWVAFGAIGGGFGLGAFAESVSSRRKEAQGLNVTTGELRAAEVSFNRYFDTKAVLNSLANLATDRSKAYAFAQFGLTGYGKSPADLLPQLLPKIIAEFQKRGANQAAYQSLNLQEFGLSPNDMRVLLKDSGKELNEAMKKFAQNIVKYTTLDQEDKVIQDFMVALHDAGQVIETALVKGLQPIMLRLPALSAAVADFFKTLLESDEFKKWMDELADKIRDFAKYLSSTEFKEDIQAFLNGVKKITNAMLWIADHVPTKENLSRKDIEVSPWLDWFIKKNNQLWGADETKPDKNEPAAKKVSFNADQSRKIETALGFFQQQGLTRNQAIGIVANLQRESGLNPTAQGDLNKKTGEYEAYGIAQWHKDRQEDFAKAFGHSIKQSTIEEQMKFVLYELQNKEIRYGEMLKSAVSPTQATAAYLASERPQDRTGELAQRNAIAISINNNTGGSAVVSASQLGTAQ